MKSTFISFVLTLLVLALSGCATGIKNQTEHWAYLPSYEKQELCDVAIDEEGDLACPAQAVCISGDCINGVGTKRSPDKDLSYTGYWENGHTRAGNYEVRYQAQKFISRYDGDGYLQEGFLLVESALGVKDYFNGRFQRQEHPFTRKTVLIPESGEYVFASGARLKGDFIAVPTAGYHRDKLKGTGRVMLFSNFHLFFIGTVTLGEQSETGIYVQRDYRELKPLDMVPSDEGNIEKLHNEYLAEMDDLQGYRQRKAELAAAERRRKAQSRAAWGKIFTLAAGVALVNSADMSVQAKSDFLSAYAKDVMTGSTDNMTQLQQKYRNNQSVYDIYADNQRRLDEIYAQKMEQVRESQQSSGQPGRQNQLGGTTTGNVPTIASSPTRKASHKVCGGPYTVPAMNGVFDTAELNRGKASPEFQCPEGGAPVMEGSYDLAAGRINWLVGPPNRKQEPVRNDNGRPIGARVSWDAFRYECLCRTGPGTQAGGYQQ